MKLYFGKGKTRLFGIKTDYFLDNGACIQICANDTSKAQFNDLTRYTYWIFSRVLFDKLLKQRYIKLPKFVWILRNKSL
jgi:hypothetical protein